MNEYGLQVEDLEIFEEAGRLATCTVMIPNYAGACAFRIYGITIRRGRGNTFFVNLPATFNRESKRWQPTIECCDDKIMSSIRRVVLNAYHHDAIVDRIVADAMSYWPKP